MVLSRARLLGGCLSLVWAISAGACGSSDSAPTNGPGNPPGGSNASGGSSGSGGSASSGAASGSDYPGSGTGGAVSSGSGGSFSGTGGSVTSAGSGGSNGRGSGGTSTAGGTGGSSVQGTGGTFAGAGGSGPTGVGGASSAGGSTASAGGAGGGPPVSGAGGSSATGSGGRSGTTAPGQCPSNAIFCADFESGAIPAQAVFYPEYLRATMSTYLTVDAAIAHSGTHSARFAGTSSSQMLGVVTGTATFWTRVYVRSDIDINTNAGHATYVAATDASNDPKHGDPGDPNVGEQIRVGEHECQLEINRRSDDKELLSNGGTYQCSGGTVFARDTWYCLETYYDGPGSEVRVFVNGSEATSLHATNWGPYQYEMFKFGFENYSSQMRNMWYDDVAIAPQRIGCQ